MQIIRRLSITVSKRVLSDASNFVRGSNIQCRGRASTATTTPSDSAAVKRKRKWVPKEERRAMVEAFVNKYKAMNGGKFPQARAAMKEVGGSFYVIRKIVQELEYNSRMSAEHKDTAATEAIAGQTATKKDDSSIKVEKTLSSAMLVKHRKCKDGQQRNEILLENELTQNSKHSTEVKDVLNNRWTVDAGLSQEAQSLPISGAEEQTFLHEMSRTSGKENKDAAVHILKADVESNSHSDKLEIEIKEKVSPMENLKIDGLKQMDDQKHSPELEKPTRELSNEQKDDTQTQSKSSMWKNLKSLADGIVNMWRKL